MVCHRMRLTTPCGNATFSHLLRPEDGRTAADVVEERNFLDLRFPLVPMWLLLDTLMLQRLTPFRAVGTVAFWSAFNHMDFMPRVDSILDERMFGVFNPSVYPEYNVNDFNNDELGAGFHLWVPSLQHSDLFEVEGLSSDDSFFLDSDFELSDVDELFPDDDDEDSFG